MLSLDFDKKVSGGDGLEILCLGAHCDDIEIGCGGTLLRLIREGKVAYIHWVVFCSTPVRKKEAESSAGLFLDHTVHTVTIHEFRDGYTPGQWSAIKDTFEQLKTNVNPDLIFTHTRDDRHQDHRTIHDFTWNTFRNHMILEYEIPKYDGDLGQPNLFVSVEKKDADRKKEIILNSYESQKEKHWLDEKLLASLMRLRGMECVSTTSFAEGFYSRKIIL